MILAKSYVPTHTDLDDDVMEIILRNTGVAFVYGSKHGKVTAR